MKKSCMKWEVNKKQSKESGRLEMGEISGFTSTVCSLFMIYILQINASYNL